MHGTHNSGEHSIRFYADLFTTFLYAAGLHIVIGEFVSHSVQPSLKSSLPVLFVVIYFLFDLFSRIRLPNLINDKFSAWEEMAKAFLEAVGLLFLIMGTVLFVKGEAENRETFFAAFLIVSFLWNSVLFRVMPVLNWTPLLDAIWRGTVLDIEAVKEYASRFYSKYEELVKAENEARNKRKGSNTSQTFLSSLATTYCTGVLIGWTKLVRTFAQYVGIHLGVANLVVGILLFGHVLNKLPPFLSECFNALMLVPYKYAAWPFVILIIVLFLGALEWCRIRRKLRWWKGLVLTLVIAALLLICAFCTCAVVQSTVRWLSLLSVLILVPAVLFIWNGERPTSKFNKVGGVVTIILWLMFFAIVPVNALLVLMACEQIIMSLFLQLVTDSVTSPPLQVPPTSSTVQQAAT